MGETATPDNRGLLGSCIQGMVTVGVLLGMGIGSFNSWRWLSVVCLLADLAWAFLLLLVPETPAYLLSKNKEYEARASLSWLRNGSNIEEELLEIKTSLEESSKLSRIISDLF